jgi:NAD(P)-dependent dehydrogenase (short-subunit alcohol dehydrogenase family)
MKPVYIVTGASRGIGAATVDALEALGKQVLSTSRIPSDRHWALDVNSDKSISAFAAKLRQEGYAVAGLINNAGALVNRPYNMLAREDFEAMASANWIGPALLIQALADLFTSDAHIVNISSMGGYQGASKYPGLAAYASSKMALVGLTECLQAEWGERGWTFNALCLGAVQTEMLAEAFPGYTAPTTPKTMGSYVASFAVLGHETHAGCVLPVTKSNP